MRCRNPSHGEQVDREGVSGATCDGMARSKRTPGLPGAWAAAPAAHRAPVQPGEATAARPSPPGPGPGPGPAPDAEGEGAESTAARPGARGQAVESLYRAAGVKRSGRVDTCSAVPLGNACAWAFGIASERAICGVMSSTISVRVVVSLLFENSRPSAGSSQPGNVRAGFLRAVLDQAGQHLGFPLRAAAARCSHCACRSGKPAGPWPTSGPP